MQRYGIDIFKFGTNAAKCFDTIQEWEDYKWLNRFSDSEIDVNVEFFIRRTGILSKHRQVGLCGIYNNCIYHNYIDLSCKLLKI